MERSSRTDRQTAMDGGCETRTKTGEKERRIGTSTQKVEIKINKREIEKLQRHLVT